MNLPRSSGVQLHPTSLPSGRLGPDAYAWVDWLADAGQTWWQMLPLGPPDKHGSPYNSASAFAAWPGLLAEPSAPVSAAERDAFRERSADWIEDWIAFAGPEALDAQVRFDREWAALRGYAADRGVKLIGDAPIYVADGSADALAREVAGTSEVRWARGGERFVHPAADPTGFVRGLLAQYDDVTDLEVRRTTLEDSYMTLVHRHETASAGRRLEEVAR